MEPIPLPDLARVVTTVLTGNFRAGSLPFTLTVENGSDDPFWRMSLMDFDDNVCAVGHFPSEAEAIANLGGFLAIAVPLYAGKHGKYGPPPIIDPGQDGLSVTIPPPWGSE